MVSKEENTGVEGLISNQHPSGQGEKLIVSKYNVTKRTAIWWGRGGGQTHLEIVRTNWMKSANSPDGTYTRLKSWTISYRYI